MVPWEEGVARNSRCPRLECRESAFGEVSPFSVGFPADAALFGLRFRVVDMVVLVNEVRGTGCRRDAKKSRSEATRITRGGLVYEYPYW